MPSSSSTKLALALSAAAILATALALPQQQQGRTPGALAGAPTGSSNGAYQFAADVEAFLSGPVQQSFSCEGRIYGYYGDVANACQVFHICLPVEDDAGSVIETQQWSFVCGNQTVFDQQTLTCNYPADSFPCAESESLYGQVEFGKVEPYQGNNKN